MTPERWAQIGQLFQGATDLQPGDRAAFLEQRCGNDGALRREVEALLETEDLAGPFLASGALSDMAKSLAAGMRSSLVGQTVGDYRLLSLIGEGGMGEVYRAHDPRLGREVAVKVLLPAGFSRDPDRLRRFEQEARTAGLLNHPNILVVHHLGTHGGLPYIVSELLEGETLRVILGRGALPARQAMGFARQLAAGLAAAHSKGIVHRDLKPENLFVTGDGRIKILDFGLAKLRPATLTDMRDGGENAAGEVKTASGAILGTAGYMSPEQARGEDSDQRADIFAFGAIFYEMVTGERAFRGASMVETLNAILKEEPSQLEAPGHLLWPAVGTLIGHCLAKRAGDRFQSAHDLVLSLSAMSSSATTVRTGKVRGRWIWLVAAACCVGVALIVGSSLRRPPQTAAVLRFAVAPPAQAVFAAVPATFHAMAISPDGRQLAFVGETEGKLLLWTRPLDALTSRPLAGTEGAMSPFWSPDSRHIGFFADGRLRKIDANGGVPTTICEAGRAAGSATWNREGTILFTGSGRSGDHVAIYRVSDAGGDPEPVTTRPGVRNEGLHLWPTFLPDGHHFLYLECNQPAKIRPASVNVVVRALGSNETRRLLEVESRVAFAQGFLLYVREGILFAHPFDPNRLRFTGEPTPIVDRVSYFASGGYGSFSVSETGVLVYGAGEDVSRLAWHDRHGHVLRMVGEPGDYQAIRISPDGTQSVVAIADRRMGTTDLWLLDHARGTRMRFTADPRVELSAVWSPDGKQIIFAADRGAPPFLHLKTLSQSGEGRPVSEPGTLQQPTDWSPDGGFVLYSKVDRTSGLDLWLLPIAEHAAPFPWLGSRFQESDGRFSPDGHFIAYVSDESGRPEVYVQPFRREGARQRVSTTGGEMPRWRRDEKELFYLAPNNTLMAVPVALGSKIEAGAPAALFATTPPGSRAYDVSANGQQFLVATAVTKAQSTPVTVVINWTAELRR